jgi:hypothetical protein
MAQMVVLEAVVLLVVLLVVGIPQALRQAKEIMVGLVHQLRIMVAVVVVQIMLAARQLLHPALEVMVQHQAFQAHRLPMLAAVAVVDSHLVLEVQEAAVRVQAGLLLEHQEQQTLEEAVVVLEQAEVLEDQPAQEVVVSLLFDMLTHLLPQHLPQAHPQSQWLAATVFTNGLDQGVSHSDGTLCKTQF